MRDRRARSKTVEGGRAFQLGSSRVKPAKGGNRLAVVAVAALPVFLAANAGVHLEQPLPQRHNVELGLGPSLAPPPDEIVQGLAGPCDQDGVGLAVRTETQDLSGAA